MILWVSSLGRAQLDVSGLPHVCKSAARSDGGCLVGWLSYTPSVSLSSSRSSWAVGRETEQDSVKL